MKFDLFCNPIVTRFNMELNLRIQIAFPFKRVSTYSAKYEIHMSYDKLSNNWSN